MATGQREMMVRTPMNGLIQMAVPVISNWKFEVFQISLNVHDVFREAFKKNSRLRAVRPQNHGHDREHRL